MTVYRTQILNTETQAQRGRPRSVDRARVLELTAAGYGPAAVARMVGMARSGVYRVLATGKADSVAGEGG